MAQNTETPPETLRAATTEAALPLSSLALLGTYERSDGPAALIRTPNGNTRFVEPGDKIGASTVTAIEMGVLHLARGSDHRKLTLPDHQPAPAADLSQTRPVARPEAQVG